MISIFAITLPVSLFIAQAWFSFDIALSEVLNFYLVFLAFYFLGCIASFAMPRRQYELNRLTPAFDWFAKTFVVLKVIITTYFFFVFLHYFQGNGYLNVRQYMTGDDVQSSPFYFVPFMYIDAYIVYPLNYIVLMALYLSKNKRLFIILLICIALQTIVFYASRTVFYNALLIMLFSAIYKRTPILKVLGITLTYSIVALVVSTVLLFNRDRHVQFEGIEPLINTLVFAVGGYHTVPPILLDAIVRDSAYFNSGAGYGLATFGFLIDPLISLMPVGDAKSLMASKVLSAEAQRFTLNIGDDVYNAFTTFLYPAVFDFGSIAGPAIYGTFFGFAITSAFKRRDAAGFLAYVILSYFVFFNSFTFFITGDWFWVLVFILVFFVRPRLSAIALARAPTPNR